MNQEEIQDKWTDDALSIFTSVYNAQFARTKKAIRDSAPHTVTPDDALAIRQALADQYRTEPNKVYLATQRFYDQMAVGAMEFTINEIERTLEEVDLLISAVNSLSAEAAQTFARRMSESSLRLTYLSVDRWLETEGSTMSDLFSRMEMTWKGQRPKAAAVTETTRLFADTRIRTFEALGVTHFQPLTRNDGRVRPSHQQYADEGPYPLTRTDRIPPYDDVNCRCTIVAVVE